MSVVGLEPVRLQMEWPILPIANRFYGAGEHWDSLKKKDDPLKRIQEEINEVARRERELRQKDGCLDEQRAASLDLSGISDDSGISSASSPVNGMSTNHEKITINQNGSVSEMATKLETTSAIINATAAAAPTPYKRSFTVNPTSHHQLNNQQHQAQMGTLTRAMSTPQIFTPTAKRFPVMGGQKGMMQRFLASRGKFSPAGQRTGKELILTSVELNRSPINITPEFSPPIIERDEHGRPLRRGYVPVEEKIQKELRDLKNRESELKRRNRMSKLRQSQPDLLDAVNDSFEFDSGEESDDTEHCYPPGKLRASKSIGELCNALNNEASLSPRDSPSPQFARNAINHTHNVSNHHSSSSAVALRPVLSLAQLCEVDPEEAPSSHRLIAQWENLIQQRQEVA